MPSGLPIKSIIQIHSKHKTISQPYRFELELVSEQPDLNLQSLLCKPTFLAFDAVGQLYYDALARANNGFYPMGANGLWHGGVHFDAGTGALLDQSSVRCIADGEVIAYRIDERYPTSQYGEGPTVVHLPFSTGFVLVKHRLELPALPTAATPASASTPATATPTATPGTPAPVTATPATPTAAPAAETLTFYSLYMHLLDWAGYSAPEAPTPAAFLAASLYTVSTRPSDPQVGLRVRKNGPGSDILALLPKGCKVTLGEPYPDKENWKQLLSVDEGAAIPPLASGVIGWVYSPELSGNTVADLAKDEESALTLSHQGLRVRKEGKRSGTIIGVLPRGAQFKVGPKQTGGYCKVLAVLDYHGVPALPNGADGKPLGYVYHADLDASRTPPAFNAVTLLPTPQPVKAGELIGHLGQYQDHDEEAPRALLHLEVFSCDDVPAFISKSQARAASLPNSAKTLLKIHKRASKLIPHREGISASNPPQINDEGVKVGVDLIIPQSLLDTLPSSSKILVPAKNDTWACSSEIRWWRLDGLLADDAGNPINGWIAEQDLITTRHSPWEWQGFDFISETTSASEQLANHLAGQCLLSEAELPDYQAHISTADNGPIKTRLYDIIDGADGTTRNEKLSVAELRAALGKPWHAQSISQLISHYESEWYWQDAKWDELDKLMEHTPATPNTDWVAEKARIKTLSWWDKVAGQHGVTAGGMAWHFQPAGIVGNFISKRKNICAKCNKRISIIYELMKKICPSTTTDEFIKGFILHTDNLFEKYGINSCAQVTHLLAQAKHETKHFTAFRESLYYSSYTAQALYDMAPTAINNGFTHKGLTFPTHTAKLQYIEDHLLKNDAGYGQHCFGCNEYPDNDYRGRGLLHLTHYTNYHACALAIGKPIAAEPTLVQSDVAVIVETGLWFWKTNGLKNHAENPGLTEEEAVEKITRIINGGTKGLAERKQFKREITEAFIELYGNCSA